MDPRSRRSDRGGAGGYDDPRDARGAGGPPPPPGGSGDRYHPYGGGGRPAHGGNLGALPPPPGAAAGGYDPRAPQGAYGGAGVPAGQIDLQNIVNTVHAAQQGGHAGYPPPPGPGGPPGGAYGAPVGAYGAHAGGYPPGPPVGVSHDPRFAYGVPPGPAAAAPGRALPPAPGARAVGSAGAVSDEVLCPSESAGKVIGHGGESINSIQANSGAHVKIQPSSEVAPGQPRVIYITGAAAAVAEAARAVNEIIREHQAEKSAAAAKARDSAGLGGGVGGAYGGASRSTAKEEMPVPIDMALVGKIIGRGGETIRRLSEESGARLQIERDQGRVMIRGDHEACVRARELILDVLNDPNPPGAGGGGGGAGDYAKHSMPAEGCEGKIIGKGGESIRELCQRTGAKIQIDKDAGTVAISGKKDNVDAAIAAVQAIIDEGPTVYMRPGGLPGEGGDRGYGGGYGGSDAGGGGGGYAAPPADKPLWETHKSPEGYTYYYNTTTGETQWDMPDDFPGVAPP